MLIITKEVYLMLIFFSVLFYPVFFILLYAIGEYIFPTRNGAMIFATLGAFICSYLYYTIRSKVSQLMKKKLKHKNRKKATLTGLMLIDEKEFAGYFPDSLADNSYNGLNEEKLLEFLRINGTNDVLDIYSIKGMTSGCRDLLNLLKIKYAEHSPDEILDKTVKIDIPEINVETNTSALTKILKGIFSKQFGKFAIKYGVILILISLITPYKIYYIVFGSILIIYSLVLKILRRLNLQNQIPYLRS